MNDIEQKLRELRRRLHDIPERSGGEVQTKAELIRFLKANTALDIVDRGGWFYATPADGSPAAPAEGTSSTPADGSPAGLGVAIRADMDAVTGADGKPYHGCGHDGHCAVLAGCALLYDALRREGKALDKSVYFLFQPEEETGAGAQKCRELFDLERIGAIYGMHNIPGQPAATPLLIRGVFACASRGLTLNFAGRQSHAAYPEDGINPAFAIAELISGWEQLTRADRYSGLTLATIVNVRVGTRAFGVSAGDGELSVTLRAHNGSDLDALEAALIARARELCFKQGLTLDWQRFDVFPETRNDDALYERAASALDAAGIRYKQLDEPFRWSEDFGVYQKERPGLFLGVGAGEDAAPLHTPQYEWNDGITLAASRILLTAAGILV